MTAMITVTGNVGRIDVRDMPDGNKVVNFGVASNQKRKDKETTTWVNCVAFSQLAGMLEQHLRQGAKVLVITGQNALLISLSSYHRNLKNLANLKMKILKMTKCRFNGYSVPVYFAWNIYLGSIPVI